MNLKNLLSKITDSLLNDEFRQSFMLMVLAALLAVITSISAIPHFIDDSEKLMAIVLTCVSVFSAVIFLLTLFFRKRHPTYRYIFLTMVVFFFGYLNYDGGPDGFLHFWILLIPAFSFVAFGLFEGFICAIPLLVIMICFYWTPLGQYAKYPVETHLSTDFRMRMTFVYLVSLLLGFAAELFRFVAAKRLRVANEHFEFISLHDSLTNLANQNFLARYLDNVYKNRDENTTFGCLFVDVDNFKKVNDQYGHLFGNVVLVKIAETLAEEKSAFVCRWGGDEFVVCFTNIEDDRLVRLGEKFRTIISAYTFEEYPDFHITVSVGAVAIPVDDNFNFNNVLELADVANREAKEKGKDNVSLAKKKASSK